VLLSASPGAGGASRVLSMAKGSAPHFAMDVKADLSVGKFYDNFDMANGRITNEEVQAQLEKVLSALNSWINVAETPIGLAEGKGE
jgi:chromate reductase